uniref:RRM domain-containing protein n=1 Tax=Mesocestoides corti TaxID=53468 RepID=A0A5K3ELQ3_MESCO
MNTAGKHQSGDLLCGVCNKHFNDPCTLPCAHSFCRQPCLIAFPGQAEVRCFWCRKRFPASQAVHNADLEARVKDYLIQERSSIVRPCEVCHQPTPQLVTCGHCNLDVCFDCKTAHTNSFIMTLSAELAELCRIKKRLQQKNTEIRDAQRKSAELTENIEEATTTLESASTETLNRSLKHLESLFKSEVDRMSPFNDLVSNLRGEITELTEHCEENLDSASLNELLLMRSQLLDAEIAANNLFSDYNNCVKTSFMDTRISKAYITLSDQLIATTLVDVLYPEQGSREESPTSEVSESSVQDETPDGESSYRQVFVGGLRPHMNRKVLTSYFCRFGAVKFVNVVTPRGFAYVTFADAASAAKATSERVHFIAGGRVEVQKFLPKNLRNAKKASPPAPEPPTPIPTPQPQPVPPRSRKVFVGGLHHDTTSEELRAALSELGPVEDARVVPGRGYGLAVFENLETFELAVSNRWHLVGTKRVELVPFVSGKTIPNELNRAASLESLSSSSSYIPSVEACGRKLYVEGFGKGTSDVALRMYFAQFGAILLCQVSGDRGSLVFESPHSLVRAVKTQPHYLDGHKLTLIVPSGSPKSNLPKENTGSRGLINTPSVLPRKLLLYGIPAGTTYSVLQAYFTKFGPVEFAMVNKETGTEGFVVFRNLASVDAAMSAQPHYISNKAVYLRKAENPLLPFDVGGNIPKNVSFESILSNSSVSSLKSELSETLTSKSPSKLPTDVASSKGVSAEEAKKRIYVGHLPLYAHRDDLVKYFSAYGTVETAFVAKTKGGIEPRFFGFVYFSRPEDVEKVLAFPGTHRIRGQAIIVKAVQPDYPLVTSPNPSIMHANACCQ